MSADTQQRVVRHARPVGEDRVSSVAPPERGLELLEGEYRSGAHALDTDFFGPCLARCSSYDRAVGYFTSHALASWAAAVPRLLTGPEVSVRLVVGPVLLAEDKDALLHMTDEEARMSYRQRMADTLLEDTVTKLESGSDQARLELFCMFLATGRLQICFAFPVHVPDADIYHEKFGIFSFPGAVVSHSADQLTRPLAATGAISSMLTSSVPGALMMSPGSIRRSPNLRPRGTALLLG